MWEGPARTCRPLSCACGRSGVAIVAAFNAVERIRRAGRRGLDPRRCLQWNEDLGIARRRRVVRAGPPRVGLWPSGPCLGTVRASLRAVPVHTIGDRLGTATALERGSRRAALEPGRADRHPSAKGGWRPLDVQPSNVAPTDAVPRHWLRESHIRCSSGHRCQPSHGPGIAFVVARPGGPGGSLCGPDRRGRSRSPRVRPSASRRSRRLDSLVLIRAFGLSDGLGLRAAGNLVMTRNAPAVGLPRADARSAASRHRRASVDITRNWLDGRLSTRSAPRDRRWARRLV